ncbi:ABC transporter substrate-binding protein [Robbsia sp. Bb-Pol-6]|uniref:ABC transporter substrate-binding protein n=1 Tax=Robbsia betulipollinis TaxID=2981849 RepID=A0ABT3ZNQ5_9BURK|nr:ABC transporter substrate-binding protein [Robbsia betulipollinis]MCY0387947.1 ABC transporter substrate-binding protein [Robbsia betulipollinis]
MTLRLRSHPFSVHSLSASRRAPHAAALLRRLPHALALGGAVLLLAVAPGLATAAPTASAASAPVAARAASDVVVPPASASADATLKAAVEGTLAAIRSDPVAKGGDPARTAQLVETHFLPFTDFRRTARLAAGDAWNSATPQQQEAIFQQFQALLVRVYAAQLTQIQGQHIQFRFDHPKPVPNSTDVVVRSQVHTDTDDMSTGYRLAKTPTGYKVYDIDLMGIWLIQVYRQQFGDQLRQGGVDGLIKFLAAHNAAHGAD